MFRAARIVCPTWFMQWVNRRDRCHITVCNDADGNWYVQIGGSEQLPTMARGLRRAMWKAFWACERDAEWQWTSDYLRQLPDIARSG